MNIMIFFYCAVCINCFSIFCNTPLIGFTSEKGAIQNSVIIINTIINGSLCVLINSNVSLWVLIVPFASLWIQMGPYE